MELNRTANKSTNWFVILLLVNFLAVTFWIVSQHVDVYRYAIVGALFELFWLPSIAIVFLIPLVSLYLWYKDKFKRKSKFLYLLGFYVLSVVVIYLLT